MKRIELREERSIFGRFSSHIVFVSLVAGFLFGTVGAMWSFLFVDRLAKEGARLGDAKVEIMRQIQAMNAIASEYFIANQQGDLIYILAQQANVRKDVATLIYQGNVLDRATPVRNMLGALAIARQLDYRKSYDAYLKLNDAARQDFTLANYSALKELEKTIISKGQERVPALLKQLFEIEKAISANAAAESRNRVIGLISAILGNFLLLLSNLVAAPIRRPGPEAVERGQDDRQETHDS